ncbi:MAG: DsbE family thiol:disulfide interchange protein [Rhodospirillales bacterium]|nr:MAG: DsbE family thiol:disulfide interchange protein [Rhodospirillales bacterium]
MMDRFMQACARTTKRVVLVAAFSAAVWAAVGAMVPAMGTRAAAAFDPWQLMLMPIGQRLPPFALPPLEHGGAGLFSDDLAGQVAVINVFASWCAPCLEEHPHLMALALDGIAVYGINYRDTQMAALAWLDRHGDPYRQVGFDADGWVTDEIGLFGLPQTLVVDRSGVIRHVHPGALDATDIEVIILPLIERLTGEAG